MSAKLVMAAVGLVSSIFAQTPPSPRVTFDVATVKPSPPVIGDLYGINLGTIRNGKVTLANTTLSDCIRFAYGLVSDAQLSGPDWIKSKEVRFDIVAQAPPDTSRKQLLLMLQALLAERLKVALHHEQRDLPFLALVVGKNGSKLYRVQPGTGAAAGPVILGRIVSDQMSMSSLAVLLSRFERTLILDKTDLEGLFRIDLQWTSDRIGASTTDGKASIYTAVQEQLGLKLEARRGPLDVLVVDFAERVPSDN